MPDALPAPARALIAWAGALGFAGVAGGAFAAHGIADPTAKALLQTGGHYALVHALATLAAVFLAQVGASRASAAGWCFAAGGSVFAASLYALALGAPHWLGAVTPLGGLAMLAGWALLAWSGLRRGS